MRRITRFAGPPGQSGSAAIEAALIAPVLALLAIGIADFGAAVYRDMQVQNAAQAGATYAMRHAFDATAIGNAVLNSGAVAGMTATPAPAQSCGCPSGGTISIATCGTACAGGALAGTYVTVSAQAVYTTILPYPGIPSSLTFAAASVVRTQ
jgi:Flp pilus assembly protein TadG